MNWAHLTAFFPDEKHIFCYHDKDRINSLFFVKCTAPCGPIRLRDKDWEIDLA